MNKTKIRSGIFIILIVFLIGCVPVASIENGYRGSDLANGTSTITISPADLYITIDPIGNHTLGDIFFINGTTNLPVNVTKPLYLSLDISTANGTPDRSGSFYISIGKIQPGENGVNIWSINTTTTRWATILGPDKIVSDNVTPGKYVASVYSHNPYSYAEVSQSFFILASVNEEILNQTSTSIQPSTSQTAEPIKRQSSPLSLVLPIVVLSALAILRHICGKNRD